MSENTAQAGESVSTTDPDLRPVGRCFNELNQVRQLTQQARTVNAQLQDALTAFWACRDAAAMSAGIQSPSAKAASFLATTFEGREDDLKQIEKLIEDGSKTF